MSSASDSAETNTLVLALLYMEVVLTRRDSVRPNWVVALWLASDQKPDSRLKYCSASSNTTKSEKKAKYAASSVGSGFGE
jgi:hypothetical protein